MLQKNKNNTMIPATFLSNNFELISIQAFILVKLLDFSKPSSNPLWTAKIFSVMSMKI